MINKRIIFQHIPKTAGTSFTSVLIEQFKKKKKFICGKDGVLDDFIKMNPNERNDIKLLTGHVDYGIHKYFNDDSLYITFLREPIDRVLSHYYFIRSNKKHRYHEQANRLDINQFILSGLRPKMNNCITRMLSGIQAGYNCCNESMIETAKENVKSNYLFVGFLSEIDISVKMLGTELGCIFKPLPRLNATERRPLKENAAPETIDIITEYNKLDIQLYYFMFREYANKK